MASQLSNRTSSWRPNKLEDSLSLLIEINWNSLLSTCSQRTSSRLLKCDYFKNPSYLQVDNGKSVPVPFTHNAVEILESGWEEGTERSLHSDGLSLCEAPVVSTTDSLHSTGLRGVQGNQVKLWDEFSVVSSLFAETWSRNISVVPPGLKCDGGLGFQEREVFVERWLGSGDMGRWAFPAWCGWNTYRLADLRALCNLDISGLWGQGTVDLDDSVNLGWLAVGNMGLVVCGVSVDVDQAGPGSQAGKCRCLSLVSKGRQGAVPRQQPRSPEYDIFDTR